MQSTTESQKIEKQNELENLIRLAGNTLLQYWPDAKHEKNKELLGVQHKPDGSVVTQADFASNKIIVDGLRQLFPDDGILSEEIPPENTINSKERVWIIDPLDGTQSFVNGNDDFSVLVALCVGKSPVTGFLYFPARNQFAYASRGSGAWLNGKQVHVSNSKQARKEAIYIRHCELEKPEFVYPRWMDSGLAMLSLGQGSFDGIVIKLVSHREWDLAAPAVFIEEAGGKVTDENGQPIAFNEGAMNCRYFVASNGIIHSKILESIKI